MAKARKSSRRATSLIPEQELPEIFRALVLQCPMSVWLLDKNGTNVLQNQACRQLLGIEKDEETVGRYNIFKDDELAAQGFMPQIKKVFDEGGSTDLIVDYDFSKVKHVKVSRPPHKILRWFLFAINDKQGRVRYVCVHHEDYTERVRAEEALRESEARYRSFVENFQGIAFQGELGFKPIFFHGAAEAITGYTEDEFTTGNPRWDQIVHPDDLPHVQKTGAPLRSVPNFSVEREYRILRKDGQTRWVHEMIQNVCDESGVPSFVQGVIYDVTERKRTEQELSESEERYRAVAQSAVDAIVIADSSGNIVSWNEAAEAMFGYAEAEVLGKPATVLMPERYKEAHQTALERMKRGVKSHVTEKVGELYGLRKDGSEFPVDLSVSTWTTREGRFCSAIIRDVSERKRAEEALRSSEERYRTLIETSPDAVTMSNLDGKIVMVNPQTLALHGYERAEEMIGRSFLEFVVPEDRPRVEQGMRKTLETGGVRNLRFTRLKKDGTRTPIEVNASLMRDREGNPTGFVAVIRDITERVRAEEARRRLAAIVEGTSDFAGIADVDGRTMYINSAGRRMVGIGPDEDITGVPVGDFHPEWAKKIVYEEAIPAAIREDVWRGETALLTRDGREIPVSQVVIAHRRSDGSVEFVATIARDVTERRRAEAALRESEERYRAVAQSAVDAIVSADSKGNIVSWNDAAQAMFGYAEAEVLGKPVAMLMPERYREAHRKGLERMRTTGESRVIGTTVEFDGLKRDGSEFPLELSLSTWKTGEGRFYTAIIRDITERKVAEERRRELEEHKRDFYRRTILAATEGKLTICEPEEIERIAGSPITSWDIARGEDVGAIRNAVGEIARSRGMDESRIYDLALCVGETATNAFTHAGGGTASLHEVPDGLLFVVLDHGSGIEALTLPEVALVRGYSTTGSLGMGYKAIISFADKVYLATGPSGTTVAIEMKLHPQEKPLGAAALPETWTSSQ